MGRLDRTIRVVAGMVVVYAGYNISPLFYIIAAFLFLSATVGKCHVYKLLNIGTT